MTITQHQAPEVTGELAGCPFCGTGCSDDHNAVQVQPYVSHGEWSIICECCQAESGIYMSKAEAITAWNTRATQPLSLTVDPVLAFEEYWGASKYRTRNMIGYSDKKCLAWEAYSAALQSLSLPVDIDRSGLAQEVDDITYAGVGP